MRLLFPRLAADMKGMLTLLQRERTELWNEIQVMKQDQLGLKTSESDLKTENSNLRRSLHEHKNDMRNLDATVGKMAAGNRGQDRRLDIQGRELKAIKVSNDHLSGKCQQDLQIVKQDNSRLKSELAEMKDTVKTLKVSVGFQSRQLRAQQMSLDGKEVILANALAQIRGLDAISVRLDGVKSDKDELGRDVAKHKEKAEALRSASERTQKAQGLQLRRIEDDFRVLSHRADNVMTNVADQVATLDDDVTKSKETLRKMDATLEAINRERSNYWQTPVYKDLLHRINRTDSNFDNKFLQIEHQLSSAVGRDFQAKIGNLERQQHQGFQQCQSSLKKHDSDLRSLNYTLHRQGKTVSDLVSLDLRSKLLALETSAAKRLQQHGRLENRLERLENITYSFVNQISNTKDKLRSLQKNILGMTSATSLARQDVAALETEVHRLKRAMASQVTDVRNSVRQVDDVQNRLARHIKQDYTFLAKTMEQIETAVRNHGIHIETHTFKLSSINNRGSRQEATLIQQKKDISGLGEENLDQKVEIDILGNRLDNVEGGVSLGKRRLGRLRGVVDQFHSGGAASHASRSAAERRGTESRVGEDGGDAGDRESGGEARGTRPNSGRQQEARDLVEFVSNINTT